jgi:hypothetical protein
MIDVYGISPRDPLHARVLEHLGDVLSPLRLGKVPARVSFEDENGPKGGPDTTCTITVRIPRRKDIVVGERAATARLAFDAAFECLRRQVVDRRDAQRGQRRRPKKYYLAKQLLEGNMPGAAA